MPFFTENPQYCVNSFLVEVTIPWIDEIRITLNGNTMRYYMIFKQFFFRGMGYLFMT